MDSPLSTVGWASGPAWDIFRTVVFASAASAVFGWPVRWLTMRLRILDRPTSRSSHTVPTPRTGGIAILMGVLLAVTLAMHLNFAFLVAMGIGTLVMAISFVDDVVTIPSLPRLCVHLLVAGLTVVLIGLPVRDIGLPFVGGVLPYWVGVATAILFAVGFVNFFNFMDGINGIAASQGFFGGLSLAVLLCWAWLADSGSIGNSVITAAALAGGCLGFLPHNFPRARMFMGDVGSTTIGFSLAMLTLVGQGRTQAPWVAYVLPLGVFIYDATFTLFKRLLRGENFLKPHREHHYQLLIRCGWSHARVTGIQAAMMTVCSVGALIYARGDDLTQLAVLGVLLGMFATYSLLVHRYFHTHRQDHPPVQSVTPIAASATSEASE